MRTYAPLPTDDPMIRDKMTCPGCKKPFREGDITTLIFIGPGDDEEERALAKAGQPYLGVGIPAHAACADPN